MLSDGVSDFGEEFEQIRGAIVRGRGVGETSEGAAEDVTFGLVFGRPSFTGDGGIVAIEQGRDFQQVASGFEVIGVEDLPGCEHGGGNQASCRGICEEWWCRMGEGAVGSPVTRLKRASKW